MWPSQLVIFCTHYYVEKCDAIFQWTDKITYLSYLLEIGSCSWLAWTSYRRTAADCRTSSSMQTVANRLCCVIQFSVDSSDIFKLTSSYSRQHTHSSAVGITWHCLHIHQLLFCGLSALLVSRPFLSALLQYDNLAMENWRTYVCRKVTFCHPPGRVCNPCDADWTSIYEMIFEYLSWKNKHRQNCSSICSNQRCDCNKFAALDWCYGPNFFDHTPACDRCGPTLKRKVMWESSLKKKQMQLQSQHSLYLSLMKLPSTDLYPRITKLIRGVAGNYMLLGLL